MSATLKSLFNGLSGADEDGLRNGQSAPPVGEVVTGDGSPLDFDMALSEGVALVYFYPRAGTPGCTRQACSLRDGWSELRARGVTVYGVSRDKPAAQQAFIGKYQLPFTLVADSDGRVHRAFKAPRFSRRAYLFRDGLLAWHDLRAATGGQAADVLAALEALEGLDGIAAE